MSVVNGPRTRPRYGLDGVAMVRVGPRPGLLASIVATHLLAIILLMQSHARPAAAGDAPMTVISIAADDMPAADIPAVTVKPPKAPSNLPVPAEKLAASASEVAGTASTGCQLTSDIGTALQADAEAMQTLAHLPDGVRTPADAVMLWNGAWFDPSGAGPPVSAAAPSPSAIDNPIRAVIVESLAMASAECLQQQNTGPQIMFIEDDGRNLALAVGSGRWRWADLLEPAKSARESEVTSAIL